MELIEKSLPERCVNCQERKEGEELGMGPDAYCYNCDWALDRWEIVQTETPRKLTFRKIFSIIII